MRRLSMIFLGLSLSCAAACSDSSKKDAPEDVLYCYRKHATQSGCEEQSQFKSKLLRDSAKVRCREGGGALAPECPTKNLIGVCERQREAKLAHETHKNTRMYYYRHPDLQTAEEIKKIADRCRAPDKWEPNPELEVKAQ